MYPRNTKILPNLSRFFKSSTRGHSNRSHKQRSSALTALLTQAKTDCCHQIKSRLPSQVKTAYSSQDNYDRLLKPRLLTKTKSVYSSQHRLLKLTPPTQAKTADSSKHRLLKPTLPTQAKTAFSSNNRLLKPRSPTQANSAFSS
jgi:hypothetical protein